MTDKITWLITPETLTEKTSYLSWSYTMRMNFESNELSNNIIKGVAKIIETVETDEDGSEFSEFVVQLNGKAVSQSLQKTYLTVEAMMKALLIRYLPDNVSIQLLQFNHFFDQWNKLKEIKTGQKGARLVLLNQKIQAVQWRGSVRNLMLHFTSLVNQYKMFGGVVDENALVEKIFDILPRSYNGVKLMLRREALRNNRSLSIEETFEELQLASLDIKEEREKNN